MTANDMIPAELTIWNNMSPVERLAIMQAVGMDKSITKTFRKCLAYIKASK